MVLGLEELVKILQCRKSQGQVVIPVFYEIDPSHVRKQTGSYEEAFAKHERDFGDKDNESFQRKVSEWKAALTEAANISGWDAGSRSYKNDCQVITKIVNDVSKKLHLRYPKVLKGLVGMDKICEDIELLPSQQKGKELVPQKVQVIGIWGMGGIGKTTIAKAVFSRLFPQYDSVCFLENVREVSKTNGLTYLHEKLLSDLLKEENPKSDVVGSTFIMRRLSSKKVFIVIDDLDSLDQLDYLCEECDDLGSNSRLIITTRDRHLLSGRVDKLYEVKTWSYDESLELFNLHAFKERHPRKGYEDLSKRAVDYAGGVPLALKVLGSTLHSKSPKFWKSELNKLMEYPNERIQNVLRVSYDGLDSLQKKIFLDIAFFFKDENKDYIIRILDACGFYATSGIEVLEDKALITISDSKRIKMHDLIQEMGLRIVRQDIEDPGKRSRLRDIEEVYDVLENKKGSDVVEGITLDLSQIDDDLHLSADAFNMMINLRYLKLYIPSGKSSGNVYYPRVFEKFSNKLRFLEWNGYPLRSLPTTFCAKMLVEIRMPHSHVTKLWWGVQDLVNLEGIDLSECKQLKNLPDLSKASKLLWVDLSRCKSLPAVHPSVLSLDTLESLILDDCKKLSSLKSEKHLRSLSYISVNGCTSLKEFSVSSDLMFWLDLSNAPAIEKLHSSIGRLRRLWYLKLEGLRLRNLPNELSFLESLGELRIFNCRLVIDKQKLHVLFEGLRSLTKLHLQDCCNLCELPDNISGLSHLRELRLDDSSVEKLPASIKHLKTLEILSLQRCRKLRCVPELPPYIEELYAVSCRSLVTVSTLKAFAVQTIWKNKCISFRNCVKLDGRSLHCITESALFKIMNTILLNKWERVNLGLTVCLPGSRVPEQFTYRTTQSKITVSLPSRNSHMQGLILSVALPPSLQMKKHDARICCRCYLDGTKRKCFYSWSPMATGELNSDHVHLWYDAYFSENIAASFKQQVLFEFVARGKHGFFAPDMKECGVRLIFDSELQSFIRSLRDENESEKYYSPYDWIVDP